MLKDEHWKLRCLAITDHLKRMCLSEAYLHVCLHLDKLTEPSSMTKTVLNRHTKSDNGNFYRHPQKLKQKSSKQVEESSNRLPVWIVNNSSEVDSKRFLVEW